MPKYGATSYIDKLEEAAGISTPKTQRPAGVLESEPWSGKNRKVYKPGKTYPLKDIPLIPRAKGGPVSPSRSKLMRTKGMALARFMPAAKNRKRGKRGKSSL
jgi:hypothetical protein